MGRAETQTHVSAALRMGRSGICCRSWVTGLGGTTIVMPAATGHREPVIPDFQGGEGSPSHHLTPSSPRVLLAASSDDDDDDDKNN